MAHPLDGFSISVSNLKCFGDEGSGLFSFSPISVIIGKNNSGKSTILDLLEICVSRKSGLDIQKQNSGGKAFRIDIRMPFAGDELKRVFPQHQSINGIPGRRAWATGSRLIGLPSTRSFTADWNASMVADPSWDEAANWNQIQSNIAANLLSSLATNGEWNISGNTILRIAAERSVGPEVRNHNLDIQPTGRGVTNLVGGFITTAKLPRDLVERELVDDLNSIYLGDSRFDEIIYQENEGNAWEIYLREESKGDIRLSESGSSLQSVFIILSYFRLVPYLKDLQWQDIILAVEEPENNLHPALLRRLLDYLAMQRQKLGFSLVFTSHSPVCIDWATKREDSCILHVRKDDGVTTCKRALDYDARTQILDDLDVRGSDILQANGIVWVEGPSDKIYLRHWIDLVSGGELVEGTHYSVMFYGGKVLSNFEAMPPETQGELVSIVAINRNVALIMDSDRKLTGKSGQKPRRHINATKRRIKEEVEGRDGTIWITQGKEIENYVSDRVWEEIAGKQLKIKDEYTAIPPLRDIEAISKRKVELAHKVVEVQTLEDIEERLDLLPRLKELCNTIRRWNSIS